jgi:hypothetical protein
VALLFLLFSSTLSFIYSAQPCNCTPFVCWLSTHLVEIDRYIYICTAIHKSIRERPVWDPIQLTS